MRASDAERSALEAQLLYAVIVAGKSAAFAERAMCTLLSWKRPSETTKQFLRRMLRKGTLPFALANARTGNYTKIGKFCAAFVATRLDLCRCSPQDLERLPGVGRKTSRFFVLWTRPHETHRYAALDVHILRWLGGRGHDVPAATPASAREYERVEQLFLGEADRLRMTPRELDSLIWQAAAGEGSAEAQRRLEQAEAVA